MHVLMNSAGFHRRYRLHIIKCILAYWKNIVDTGDEGSVPPYTAPYVILLHGDVSL